MSKKVLSSERIAEELKIAQQKFDYNTGKQVKLKLEMSELKRKIKVLAKQKETAEREESKLYVIQRITDVDLPENLITILLEVGSQLRDKNISELDTAEIGKVVKRAVAEKKVEQKQGEIVKIS